MTQKWTLAPALKTLIAQINAAAPSRSKASDGTVGDSAHSARKSDHNPDSRGIVHAADITDDDAHFDATKMFDAIIASRDPRVKYLIHRGRIVSGNGGPSPWKSRAYTGANGHFKHVHVSVTDAGENDTRPWSIAQSAPVDVKALQAQLTVLGFEPGAIDGLDGGKTQAALARFRAFYGDKADPALTTLKGKVAFKAVNLPAVVPPGTTFRPGAQAVSADGSTILRHQDDGNVVVLESGKGVVWQLNRRVTTFSVQTDGNVVAYVLGVPVWQSGTAGKPIRDMTVQNDGNVVAYDTANRALWASGTVST